MAKRGSVIGLLAIPDDHEKHKTRYDALEAMGIVKKIGMQHLRPPMASPFGVLPRDARLRAFRLRRGTWFSLAVRWTTTPLS